MANILVLDGHTFSSLAIVRSLGRQGYRVYVGSSTPRAIAGASRLAVRTFVSPSVADDPEVYVKWIAELTAVEKIEGLFWTTSASTLAIDCFRHYLDASLLKDLPSTDVVHLAYDKAKTFQLAEEVGVGIPTTRTWDSDAELEQIAESVTYPCIIKPRQSCDFQDGRIVNCGQHQYIYDKNELLKAGGEWDKRLPTPLVQDLIPGFGFGVFILMQDGEVVAAFAHKRIREASPLGSSSSYRVSIDLPEDAYRASVRLLKAMGWSGVAMVEFKRDSRDGTPRLMEINGRFWYSLALCLQAGVDFPALLMKVKVGERPERGVSYKTGVGTHWVGGELMHFYKVMKGRPLDFKGSYPGRLRMLCDMARDLARHPHSDTFDLDDPWPAIYELWLLMHGIA